MVGPCVQTGNDLHSPRWFINFTFSLPICSSLFDSTAFYENAKLEGSNIDGDAFHGIFDILFFVSDRIAVTANVFDLRDLEYHALAVDRTSGLRSFKNNNAEEMEAHLQRTVGECDLRVIFVLIGDFEINFALLHGGSDGCDSCYHANYSFFLYYLPYGVSCFFNEF